MLSKTVEHPECPERFQREIARAGGTNRYGDPMFKLAWAQTVTTRQGGEWNNEDGYFRGYRDVLLGDGHPHWMLLQWADAGMGIDMPHLRPVTDIAWYRENECPKTGLSLLGEYPYHGHYQIALPLVAKWFDQDRQLHVEPFPLSTEIVDMMIPIIRTAMQLTLHEKLRFAKDDKEKEREDWREKVADAEHASKLPRHLIHSKWNQDRERWLEKHYDAAKVALLHQYRVMQMRERL